MRAESETFSAKAADLSVQIAAVNRDIDFLDRFNAGGCPEREELVGVIQRMEPAIRSALLARRKELELELARL